MPDAHKTSELKSEVAQQKARDEEGHFVHEDQTNPGHADHHNPLGQFFSDHTHPSKNKDDLLDVHVGNPLRRITKLLEDIKKQKAFSFTVKGSLGIAGVALALGVFGVFGGGQIICDKGIQTHIGTIKVLQIQDQDSATIPALSLFLDYFAPKVMHQRTVLIKADQTVIRIPFSRTVDLGKYSNFPVIVTGKYDSCSQTLVVTDATGIEIYPGR